ncbi:MAG: hypothetical protein EBU01_11705 [Crocinitomicaceae bacterium]|nr:hypothetical protein [Crocinitomicaceae bacterium]
MNDVEIIGRPKYRPTKLNDRTEQTLTEKSIRNLSEYRREKSFIPVDFVYERDEKDWWWCEDV